MNVVIAGAGKVGYFLAKELMQDNEVTIIDSNERAILNINNMLDVLSIHGDVEDPNTYKDIKDDIDLFIAVTDSDEVNLLSSLIIDNIVNVKEKIIRLKNDFFVNDRIMKKLGISDVITPAQEVAKVFNYLVDFPHVNNIKMFDYTTHALLLSIRACSTLDPVMISNLISESNNKLIVAGIERNDKFFIPKEIDLIAPNDLIYFFAFPEVINDIRIDICDTWKKQPTQTSIIYGANNLGIEIAKVLYEKGLKIKMVDKDFEACKIANQILQDKVEVLKNHYNLDLVLDKYGENTDVFIAATRNDEFNITKCLEAKQKNIKKVVGIHNNKQYASIMRSLGLEVIRGEKMNAYFSILEKITSSKIILQKAFCGGKGSVCIRRIYPGAKIIGSSINIPEKIYSIATFYIQRDDKFVPYKDIEQIEANDIIIAIAQEGNIKETALWLKEGIDK
jgi:trk system potassium uptake protein TrkA